MTNHWIDIGNADVILIMGSNAAENHPMSMRWVNKAREKGATLIHVDPRFTRTSAVADIYCSLRSGTDIAFLGGMIHYILADMEANPDKYNMDYVLNYTNARFKVADGFKFDVANGQFSDKATTWAYSKDANGAPIVVAPGDVWKAESGSVLSAMKAHYARYDVDTVCKVTGSDKATYQKVIEIYAATGAKNKAGTILYAMGTTQHTYGTQNVRAYTLVQLLLGNVGNAGGGINAMRGESNVQGSTDYALLFGNLPGYLATPTANLTTLGIHDFGGTVGVQALTPPNIKALLAAGSIVDADLPAGYADSYLYKKVAGTPGFPAGTFPGAGGAVNWWQNYPKYMVSLLKAYYHENATLQNEFGYHWLPKLDGATDYSWLSMFNTMYAGKMKGLISFGQNPAVGGPSSLKVRDALAKLEWMVTVELWETESAAFFKDPETDPSKIQTECWLLPAASSVEKEGSVSNSGRWGQWRYKAVEPPGEAEDDLWVITQLVAKLKEAYAGGGVFPDPITKLSWNYGSAEHPEAALVAKEINGWDYATGKQINGFANLKWDGSTCSGCWIYCGSFVDPADDAINPNRMAKRSKDGNTSINIYPNWAWSWPVNRRIIYNRASVGCDGMPFDPDRAVVTWNGVDKYTGDVADGGGLPCDKLPFIMVVEGVGRLFGFGRTDGPFPEHYEPWETPMAENLLNGKLSTPYAFVYPEEYAPHGTPDKYPIVCTTYRVTEHWQAGGMTRSLPWLVEAMPEVFIELSNELAADKGIAGGDAVEIESARGKMKAKAIVTGRLKPFKVDGKTVHEVGIPWHWGFQGLAKGDSANRLAPNIGDCNTRIPEYKAFLCNIKKA